MIPWWGTRPPILLLDLGLVDVLGRPLAGKGLSARPSGVMMPNLLKKRLNLVVGAFRECQRVSRFLTVSLDSVRETPGGTGNGPVSRSMVTFPQAHSFASSSRLRGMKHGGSEYGSDVDLRVVRQLD